MILSINPQKSKWVYSLNAFLLLIFFSIYFIGEEVTVDAGNESWGYVNVRPEAHMFWWLYRTTNTKGSNAVPLVLWLQVRLQKIPYNQILCCYIFKMIRIWLVTFLLFFFTDSGALKEYSYFIFIYESSEMFATYLLSIRK